MSGKAWLDGIAMLVKAGSSEDTAGALTDAIGQIVSHQGTCLIAFHANAPPEVLHHTLEPAGERHYLDRYLAGPYLLDPLYRLALRRDKPGVCRFRDQAPDRFRSSEYYRQYCERTHLDDEMDFLLDVAEGTAMAFVVARRNQRFSRQELNRLRQVQPIVHAAMNNVWRHWKAREVHQSPDEAVHQRLTECFNSFGASVLTSREREITQFLLRGYSTKAIARELDIAPGTVMVHKRNLFGKLGISSQYELFSGFIDALSSDSG